MMRVGAPEVAVWATRCPPSVAQNFAVGFSNSACAGPHDGSGDGYDFAVAFTVVLRR